MENFVKESKKFLKNFKQKCIGTQIENFQPLDFEDT